MTSGHPCWGTQHLLRPVEPHAAAGGATSFAPKWPRAEATAPATQVNQAGYRDGFSRRGQPKSFKGYIVNIAKYHSIIHRTIYRINNSKIIYSIKYSIIHSMIYTMIYSMI